MKRKITYAIILLFPFFSLGISDLHFVVDSSLSLPMRRVLNEYARQSSVVVTSDFLNSKEIADNIGETVDIIISVEGSRHGKTKDANHVDFASDKLYLCISKNSNLHGILNKNDTLNTTLKIIKKHSNLIVPSDKSKMGSIIKNTTKLLKIEEYIEIEDFEDVVYSVVKSGAFSILPGVIIAHNNNDNGLKVISEIPKNLYGEVNYTAKFVRRNNPKNVEAFLHFLLSDANFLKYTLPQSAF